MRTLAYVLLSICVAVGIAACNESSPTEPEPPTTLLRTVIFQDGGALDEHRDLIHDILQQAMAEAATQLPIDPVTVTVSTDLSRVIPGYGLGGYAPTGDSFEIVIDPAFPGLAQILPSRLALVTAHELHHVVRWRGPGYGMTLLESMVSEGLADHFATELLGSPLPPWSQAFPESQTALYLERARPELDSAAFDFSAWFFGSRADLPRWTGYTLGYRLVADYRQRHPGQSAADLVHTSAEVFRPPS